MSSSAALLAAALALVLLAPTGAVATGAAPAPELEAGFQLLYNLQFESAEKKFREYQARHVGDPLGFAAEASGLAFREFYRLGLLRSKTLLGSKPPQDGPSPKPDEELRRRFYAALARTQTLAEQRLKKDSRDQDAWFSLALASGLSADYTYLVEKRSWASLNYAREADERARRLLELNPAYFDAYLPVGVTNYILANLPFHQRLFVRLTGISGSKPKAIQQLELVAQRGDLLKPFARILLALMSLREGDRARARKLLLELKQEFPGNSIFPMELAMLDAPASAAESGP